MGGIRITTCYKICQRKEYKELDELKVRRSKCSKSKCDYNFGSEVGLSSTEAVMAPFIEFRPGGPETLNRLGPTEQA